MAAMCIQAERVLAGVASLWRKESESRGAKCQMRPTLFMRCGSRGDLNDANYWQFSAQLADLTRSLVNCAAAAACGVLLSARRPPPMREKQSRRHTIAKGQWQVLHLKHYIMRERAGRREMQQPRSTHGALCKVAFFSLSARVYEISPFV
jgi:hypothetical protein